MSVVEVKIGQSKYKIECEISEKERILKLSENLNKKFNEISSSIKNADEKTLLVILLLITKAELEETNYNNSKKESDQNLEEIYKNLNADLEKITKYINHLANKIRDY